MNALELYILAVPFMFLGYGVVLYLVGRHLADAEARRHPGRPAE